MQETKKPVSEARLAANRANAQKSSGPKTPEGKLRSAANACQHGFAGTNFAVVRLEDPAEIDKFKADLVATYQPINSQEMFAIETIAVAQQSMRRASRLESGIFTACLNEAFDRRSDKVLVTLVPDMIATTDHYSNVQRADITRAQNRNYGLGEGFHRFTQRDDTFLRYQAQAERNYRRGIEDLQRLMSMRDQLAVPQPVCEQLPADPDPLQTPHDLRPVQFPLKPNRPSPNEPIAIVQPIETKDNPPADPTLPNLAAASAEPELKTDN